MSTVVLVLVFLLTACSHSKPAPPPVPLPVLDVKDTLSWNRNSEADMKEYRVYAAWLPGCEVGMKKETSVMLKVIPQTLIGVRPSYWRELAGSVGCYAITAVDLSINETPFSKPVPFDRR